MKTFSPYLSLATLALVGLATFGGLAVKPAQADSDTWRKAAAGAGAIAAYGAITGDRDLATIGGIAAAGAYAKYRSERRNEDRDWRYNDDWRYDRDYRNNRDRDWRYDRRDRDYRYDYNYPNNYPYDYNYDWRYDRNDRNDRYGRRDRDYRYDRR